MIRIDDNLTKLEKTQMDTINKLQEQSGQDGSGGILLILKRALRHSQN